MRRRWRIGGGSAVLVAVAVAIVLAGGSGSRQAPADRSSGVLLGAPAGAFASGSARLTPGALLGKSTRLAPKADVRITPGYLSTPLRELPNVVGPILPQPESVEPPGESAPREGQPPGFRDPVVQDALAPSAMPASTSFDGLQNQDNVNIVGGSSRPPDTDGDVGPNHYVEWVNVTLKIFNKSGGMVLGPIAGNSIFSGLPAGNICRETNRGDPLVSYDQLANRWVLSQFAFNINGTTLLPPYDQCVAVSTTSDPTGSYCLYDFNVSNTAFNDYGKIGVWPDGYYFSFGMFAGGTAYSGPAAMVVERPQMIQAGCPAAKSAFYQIPDPTHDEGLPSDVDGPNPPPAGRPNFFLFPNKTDNGLELWKFKVVDWSPAVPLTTFTKNATDIAVAPYDPSVSCTPTSRSCVPQKGTTNKLDLVGFRLMWRLAYRNWGATPPAGIPANTESLVTNETVDANNPANHVGVRWYEVRDPNGTPGAYQASTYAPDANHRWMASAAQDHSGNLAVGFTASGNDPTIGTYPEPRYAGRLLSDPLNTLAQGEATMFPGPAPVLVATGTAGDQRWGDYSNLTLDPIDDCTFWYVSEYQTDGVLTIDTATGIKRNWGTRIGKFRFPQCNSPTAVTVRSFAARWAGKRIAVRWRTASEAEILGFNVYRSTGSGPYRKLNPLLIAAKRSGSTGAAYAFVDRAVRRGQTYTYRLQVVASSGKREWFTVGAAASG